MYGAYTICLQASDPQGYDSSYDPDAACSCPDANAKPAGNSDCPCIHFTAYPREDIRIELIWNNLGPDLDLHLLASTTTSAFTPWNAVLTATATPGIALPAWKV